MPWCKCKRVILSIEQEQLGIHCEICQEEAADLKEKDDKHRRSTEILDAWR